MKIWLHAFVVNQNDVRKRKIRNKLRFIHLIRNKSDSFKNRIRCILISCNRTLFLNSIATDISYRILSYNELAIRITLYNPSNISWNTKTSILVHLLIATLITVSIVIVLSNITNECILNKSKLYILYDI